MSHGESAAPIHRSPDPELAMLFKCDSRHKFAKRWRHPPFVMPRDECPFAFLGSHRRLDVEPHGLVRKTVGPFVLFEILARSP